MPMEQLWGRAVPATDLYGLGATAIHLLSRVHPADLPVVRMKLEFASKIGVSPSMVRLLERMVDPVLEDRFQRARDVLDGVVKPAPTPSRRAAPTDQSTVHLDHGVVGGFRSDGPRTRLGNVDPGEFEDVTDKASTSRLQRASDKNNFVIAWASRRGYSVFGDGKVHIIQLDDSNDERSFRHRARSALDRLRQRPFDSLNPLDSLANAIKGLPLAMVLETSDRLDVVFWAQQGAATETFGGFAGPSHPVKAATAIEPSSTRRHERRARSFWGVFSFLSFFLAVYLLVAGSRLSLDPSSFSEINLFGYFFGSLFCLGLAFWSLGPALPALQLSTKKMRRRPRSASLPKQICHLAFGDLANPMGTLVLPPSSKRQFELVYALDDSAVSVRFGSRKLANDSTLPAQPEFWLDGATRAQLVWGGDAAEWLNKKIAEVQERALEKAKLAGTDQDVELDFGESADEGEAVDVEVGEQAEQKA
jgi:hypothetical protein